VLMEDLRPVLACDITGRPLVAPLFKGRRGTHLCNLALRVKRLSHVFMAAFTRVTRAFFSPHTHAVGPTSACYYVPPRAS